MNTISLKKFFRKSNIIVPIVFSNTSKATDSIPSKMKVSIDRLTKKIAVKKKLVKSSPIETIRITRLVETESIKVESVRAMSIDIESTQAASIIQSEPDLITDFSIGQTESFYSNYYNTEDVVEWTESSSKLSNTALNLYIPHLDFTVMELEQIFCNICSNFSLEGETQYMY